MTDNTAALEPKARLLTLPLLLLCAANFIDGMDVSTIGVALPAIQADLGINPTMLQWAVSAYVIGFGGALLLGGRVADIFGHRRVFIFALAVFTIASLVGSIVNSGEWLIATRLIKGVSAAFTTPAAVALLLASCGNGEARAKALGIFASTSATGFVLGMLLGGAVTEVSWRLTIAMGAPVTLIVALMTPFVFPRDQVRAPGDRTFDWGGAVTVTLGLVLLVFGIGNAATAGWSSQLTYAPLFVSAATLILFVLIEKRHSAPMLPLTLFRRRSLTHAVVVIALFQGAYLGFQFVATLFYQQKVGWSALATGFAFVLIGTFVMFLSPRFATAAQKRGASRYMASGLLLQASGYLFWALSVGRMDATIVAFLVQFPVGLGYAMVFSSAQVSALASIDDEQSGVATGLFFSAFQIGGGVILAITAAVFSSSPYYGWDSYIVAPLFCATLALVTSIAAAVGYGRPADNVAGR